MTRVLIADDQSSIRHQLRQMLERRHDVQVVGEASDAASVSAVVRQLKPDILLIDLGLCQLCGPLDLDSGGSHAQRTIVMLAATDKRGILAAFRLGAQGILSKTATPAMWGKTIRRVMDGQCCFENGSVAVLLEAFRESFALQSAVAQREYGLTTRELEIVTKVAAGHSNREVGRQFSICERTVKHHLTNIFDKVGVSSRLELALFAVKHRLVAAGSVVPQPPEDGMQSPGRHSSGAVSAGVL